MTKLRQHDLFPLLFVTLLFFATQFCHAKQLNTTTSFRHSIPERLLDSNYDINCACCSCSFKESLNSSEASYLFTMGPDSQSNLEFEYDPNKQIVLSFSTDPNQPLDFVVNVSFNTLEAIAPAIQATSEAGPVPITLSASDKNELLIHVVNSNKTNSATMFVKISITDIIYESATPVWIVPLAAIGGMAFVLIMLIPVCYLKSARRHNVQTLPLPVLAAEKPDLDSLYPETNFEDLKSSFPQKTCSICFDDFQESQPCRQFACQHIFHNKCVKPWLESQLQEKNNAACPNCKQPVTPDTLKK